MASHLDRFVDCVLRNPVNRLVVDRADQLRVPDWWLTAGAVFQTVWNVLDGRDPAAGIGDYDLFYFDDTDLSWEAEDSVIRRDAIDHFASTTFAMRSAGIVPGDCWSTPPMASTTCSASASAANSVWRPARSTRGRPAAGSRSGPGLLSTPGLRPFPRDRSCPPSAGPPPRDQ